MKSTNIRTISFTAGAILLWVGADLFVSPDTSSIGLALFIVGAVLFIGGLAGR